MTLPRGQIQPGSKFGDTLTQLAFSAENIVEIGTWYGEGSTLCLYKGMVRPTQHLWTFDVSSEMVESARAFYKDDPRVSVILGASWDNTSLLPGRIDLLLLDGGDGDGDKDFRLTSIADVVALDDINHLKNKENASRLEASTQWSVIVKDVNDRNGWGVWGRNE